jgi:hypothetical protein
MDTKQAPGARCLGRDGRLWTALAACLLLLACVPDLAQSAAGYDLSWSTVDGGGSTVSIGGGYSLGATAGQPDAGMMIGGGYTLAGGFWPGVAAAGPEYRVYLPVVMRGD